MKILADVLKVKMPWKLLVMVQLEEIALGNVTYDDDDDFKAVVVYYYC